MERQSLNEPTEAPKKVVLIVPDDDDTDFDDSYIHIQPCLSEPKRRYRDAVPQVIASCIIYCLVIQAGLNMSYSAVLLPQLLEADSSISISPEQASWIGGVLPHPIHCSINNPMNPPPRLQPVS